MAEVGAGVGCTEEDEKGCSKENEATLREEQVCHIFHLYDEVNLLKQRVEAVERVHRQLLPQSSSDSIFVYVILALGVLVFGSLLV